MFTPDRDVVTFDSADQVSTQAMALQPMQHQLVELRDYFIKMMMIFIT